MDGRCAPRKRDRAGPIYNSVVMVERLQGSARDDVVELLVEAFWDYPVMRFVLRDSGSDYHRHIRALIGLFVDRRFARDWPVLAVRVAEEVAAVALVDDPEYVALPESYANIEEDLRHLIGEPAWQRLDAFESAFETPDYPHYFVGMIGVRPGSQGRGLARLIMDEVVRTSTTDPRSTAVCLSTESPANLPIYAHLGFEITDEADIDGLQTWSLMQRTV